MSSSHRRALCGLEGADHPAPPVSDPRREGGSAGGGWAEGRKGKWAEFKGVGPSHVFLFFVFPFYFPFLFSFPFILDFKI